MAIADSLYNAFKEAETGGVPDPWIRTMAVPEGGSTAYGPVQITRTLAEDYLKRFKDLFNQEEISYLERFVNQGRLFARYGREPDKEGYDPRYEYGGSGDLTSPEDKAMYERVAKKMLMQHYKNNKGNLSDTIKEWRFGASSDKGRSSDERYYKEVENTFIEQPDEGQTQAPQIDSVSFLDNLTALLKERLKDEQRSSQTPSEGSMQTEEAQQDSKQSLVRSLADQIKQKRQNNEAKLERTANEAKLEAEAKEEGYRPPARKLVERLAKSKVVKSKVFDRSNLNKSNEEPKEKLAGGSDDSKDPIFGIF